jgi:dipeptidyl aminopeptidase/acylaminoacyl peptidase
MCDADGSNFAQITAWSNPVNSRLEWSPDSRQLTFGANIDGHSEVYVVNATGGSPQRRTFTTNAANPSWSADGHWILFDSTGTDLGIYKIPAEGGAVVPVMRNAGVWGPRGSPDGRFIYSIGGDDNSILLMRAPVGGGKQEVVLNLNFGFGFALAEDGIYFIPKPDSKSGYSIQFLNTTNRKIRSIASLENEPLYPTISPDRRWILYAQDERDLSNLMLVENFH